MCIRDRTVTFYRIRLEPVAAIPVSYTHLDVYKRQFSCIAVYGVMC